MANATVAVVGRPNVGKSTLFNKLTGRRTAIVSDSPGVTRDRIYGDVAWRGRSFTLVDTGGISSGAADSLQAQMRRQAMFAVDSASVILLVTDLTAGVTADDRDIASVLLKSGKSVLVCVNKCDSVGELPPDFYEFYALGFGEVFAVSAVHGHGTGDLLDRVLDFLPEGAAERAESGVIRVAVIGKPNAGKSSLVNFFAGEERAIVSDLAGTTRDATDTRVTLDGTDFVFVDTAGLRRQAAVKEAVEQYSVLRAKAAVDRADVCVITIDGAAGFTEQDAKVAGLAAESGKAAVIAVNKWDLAEQAGRTVNGFRETLAVELSFMPWANAEFISAKTGRRVSRLPGLIRAAYEHRNLRIPTGRLNELLEDATERMQPPTDKGRRLKIYYMTQSSVAPPEFVLFCNDRRLFHFSYLRYLENRIREAYDLSGTPVRFVLRERGEGGQAV